MVVDVRLFAVARQRAGRPSLSVEVDAPASVAVLKRALERACPEISPLLPHVKVAVNNEYADDDHVIASGDEVAIIPPVSGGGARRGDG